MNEQKSYLHVISFDVPYPADYGGVIDVFYKIRALRDAGINVILHCFKYGREEQAHLAELCEEVNYYPRKTGLRSQLSFTPYIVRSRRSSALEERLLQDRHPILTEGLHSTAFMKNPEFAHRTIFCRMANVEHHYYRFLAKGEKSILSKLFFLVESVRLKYYEKVLRRASLILAISPLDQKYFEEKFGKEKVTGIYAFHQYNRVESLAGKGEYILYHGKLDVAENYIAIRDMLPLFERWHGMPLWVAGMNPPPFLTGAISRNINAKLIANPTTRQMQELIQDAHGHLLLTNQATGLKLKLLAALYRGRFVITNRKMVEGTGLEPLCIVCNSDTEILAALDSIQHVEFNEEEIEKRSRLLDEQYTNDKNAALLSFLIKKNQSV